MQLCSEFTALVHVHHGITAWISLATQLVPSLTSGVFLLLTFAIPTSSCFADWLLSFSRTDVFVGPQATITLPCSMPPTYLRAWKPIRKWLTLGSSTFATSTSPPLPMTSTIFRLALAWRLSTRLAKILPPRWDPHEARFRTACSAAGIAMAFDAKPPFATARALKTPVVDLPTETNAILALGKVLEVLTLR